MIPYDKCPSPAYVLDEALLRKNLELMGRVQRESGAHIILALKGFAMWSTFPLVRQYLKGATASSLAEARLTFEEMGTKAHTYAVAYIPDEFADIMRHSSHITFNSRSQYARFREALAAHPEAISPGLRVNPEYSEVETPLYNPAAPGSRLGEVIDNFDEGLPEGIEGLHFHTLCESSADSLARVLEAFESRFGRFLPQLKWVNFGGGHLMTRADYDVPKLIALLRAFRQRYPNLEVWLEPGSAVAWQTGDLVSTVLDIVENKGIRTAILDVSFTAHMPDTLEMPYRPRVRGASTDADAFPHRYRLGGLSCLAGDFHMPYSFPEALQIGQRLVFEDMIHYTMVKTTMFNGVSHPAIAIYRESGELDVVRRFGYEDYRARLS